MITDINIQDFNYDLPNERIAARPLSERHLSKLLVYKDAKMLEDTFINIDKYLPQNSLLIFNNTKVIQARMLFNKSTGAEIEIFCLEPHPLNQDYQLVFQHKGATEWKCLIGNAKKWKEGKLYKTIKNKNNTYNLSVEIIERLSDSFIVRFEWEHTITFAEILEMAGNTPLPPYIKREADINDKNRYQTVYAKHEGSVAAPTAGLHFSEEVITKLRQKNIVLANVSLHVGAGTFKPVSSNSILNHEMHTERIAVDIKTIEALLKYNSIIPVGTTSVRTIESLYWFGVKLLTTQKPYSELEVLQWDAYQPEYNRGITKQQALEALLEWMHQRKETVLQGSTQMMIIPGYQYIFPTCVITNFHQPKSTLLLLVSAFVGNGWKDAYKYAMDNDFRFLSYGDSCLFFPSKTNEY